ncbi:MAG TPA: hypothetical protein VD837_17300 [Terriglobales bacterium]|nr:hypothetical protein [Terriglobales bacterium]
MAVSVQPVQLKPETLSAFDAYVLAAEKAMDENMARVPGAFLWSEAHAERLQQVRKGNIVAEYWGADGSDTIAVPHGLIHDLICAVFVPGRSVQQAVALVQDYENHKNIYKPEVIDSKVMTRAGDDFHVYLRLLKKKIITVVLDTYHNAHYSWPKSNRALCRSRSTQIREVENAGTSKEARSQPDVGYGFLWRLYSYWRFEQKDGGVFIECRAISLTRDIPTALAWIIKPIVRKLPMESLIHTLAATRNALASPALADGSACRFRQFC